MAEPNVRIIVGTDIAPTKHTLREDLKDIVSQISKETSVRVAVSLDKNATLNNLNSQLAQIIGNIKPINIKTNITGDKTSITSTSSDAAKASTILATTLEKQNRAMYDFRTSLNTIIKDYGNLSDVIGVNVTNEIRKSTGGLESFTLELKKIDGITQKINFSKMKVMVDTDEAEKKITKLQTMFVQAPTMKISETYLTANLKEAEKLEKILQNIKYAAEQGRNKLTGFTVVDEKQVSNLSRINELITQEMQNVEKLKSSSQDLTIQQKAEIEGRIGDINKLLKELQRLERPITAKIATEQFNKAQQLIEQIKSSFHSLGISVEDVNKFTLQYTNALNNIKTLPVEQQKDAYKALLDNLRIVSDFQNKLATQDISQGFTKLSESIKRIQISPEVSESFRKLGEQYKLLSSIEFRKLPIEQQVSAIKNYDNELKKVTNQVKILNQEQSGAKWQETQNLKFKQLSRSLEEYISKFGKVLTDVKALEMIREIRLGISSNDVNRLAQLSDRFKDLKSYSRSAGIETETFGQKLSQIASKYGIFLTLATTIRRTIRTIKDMTNTVIELDNQLNNLRIITGKSDSEIQSLAKGYQGLAKELSSTTSEVLKSSEVFLRQGRSLEDTNELIRVSQIFSKVSFTDSATAANLLTSSINGYGVAVSDAMILVDKLSAIDMNAATSSLELAEAMSKTATTAKLAGLEYDEAISYIATISEVTRDSAESIGTSLRSMLSRIQQVKLGKLMSEEGEDISNVEKVLKQYGITLRDSQKTFRDTGEVLNELAQRWQTLESAEKSEIAEQFAGKVQREKFLVLMENFDRALELQTISLESAGTATEKFGIYQESTAAKVTEFKNAFQILSDTLISADFVKGFIEFGTVAVNVFNTIMSSALGIPISLASIILAVSSLVAAFQTLGKITLFANTIKNIKSLIILLGGGTAAMQSAALAITGMNLAELGFIGTLKLATAEIIKNTVALLANPIFLGAAIAIGAITALVVAYNHFNVSLEEQIERMNEANKAYEESKTELNRIQTELKNASDRMDELNKKDKLTFAEQGELENLQKITSEMLLQEEIAKRETDRKVREAGIETLKTFTKQYKELDFSQQAVDLAVYNAELTGNNAILMSNEDNIINLLAAYDRFSKLRKEISDQEIITEYDQEQINGYNDILSYLDETLEGNINNLNDFKKSFDAIPIEERSPEIESSIKSIDEALKLIWTTIALPEWKDIKFTEIFNKKDFEDIREELNKLATEGQLTKDTFTDIKFTDFVSSMADAKIGIEDLVNQIIALNSEPLDVPTIDTFAESLEQLTNKISILSKAMQEQSQIGHISSKTYKDIMVNANLTEDEIKELEKSFKMQNGELQLSEKIMKDFINSLVEAAVTSAIMNDATDDQINSFKNLYIYTSDISDIISDLSSSMDKAESVFKDFNDTGELSTKNILDLIDAGYASIIMFDKEGRAIGLNTDAFRDLTNEMINVEIQKLKIEKIDITNRLENEKIKIDYLAQAYRHMANDAASAAAIMTAISKAEAGVISIEDMLKERNAQIAAYEASLDRVSSIPLARTKERTKKETDVMKNAFDEQKKLLDLDLKEGLISQETYYNKLQELNNKYYKDSKKHLAEYRTYQIEVLNGLSKIQEQNLQNQLNIIEEQNKSLYRFEDIERTNNQKIEIYRKLQQSILDDIKRYKELGLQETDNEVQELKGKWIKYNNTISDLNESTFESRLNASKEWISNQKYFVDFNYEQEKEAYDKIEAYTKEYYDNAIISYEKYIETIEYFMKERYNLEKSYLDKLKNELKDAIDAQKEALEATTEPLELDISIKEESIKKVDKQITYIKEYFEKTTEPLEYEIKLSGKEIESLSKQITKIKEDFEKEIEPIEFSIKLTEKEIKSLGKQINKIKEDFEKETEPIELNIKIAEKSIKELNREINNIKETLEDTLQPLLDEKSIYDDEIEQLKEIQKLEKQRKEIEDARNKLAEANLKLEEAQIALIEKQQQLLGVQGERTVRMLVGEGFEWVVDPKELEKAQEEVVKAQEDVVKTQEDIIKAQENLAEAEFNQRIYELEERSNAIQKQIDLYKEEANNKTKELEDRKNAFEKEKEQLQDQLDLLKERNSATLKELEDRKNAFEKEKEQLQDQLDLLKERNSATLKELEDRKKIFEKEKEQLQDQIDILKEQNELTLKELEDRKKIFNKEKEQLQEQLDLLKERNQFIIKQWDSIIKSLQDPVRNITEILYDVSKNNISELQSIIKDVASILGKMSNFDIGKSSSIKVKTNDSGGINYGTGAMVKATNRPKIVLNPNLTAKAIDPKKSIQFTNLTNNLSKLLDGGHILNKLFDNFNIPFNNIPINKQNQINNNGNTYMINGFKVGNDMINRPLSEILKVLPAHSL